VDRERTSSNFDKSDEVKHSIEITPEMIRAGGWAYDYWRIYEEDEGENIDAAKSIFNIMLAVGHGKLIIDEVRSHVNSRTGHEFFQTTVESVPD